MRDHRLDNAKAVLIFMVVLGHLLELVEGWQDDLLRFPLTFVYMFHMPAFVFLAGITAKPVNIARRVANLALLLLVFQAAYTLPSFMLKGTYPVHPLQPYWMLWFLLSMAWWLMALPFVLRLRAPLLVSVVIALVAGLVPGVGYPLSACRTLVFLPFFVAGHLYGRQVMAALPTAPFAKWAAPAVLVGLAVVLYIAEIGHPWLNAYANYETLSIDGVAGSMVRLGLLVASAVASLAFLVLVPAEDGWLSRIGAASMAVFLLHGFFVKASRKPIEWLMVHHGPVVVLIAAFMIALLVTLLVGRSRVDSAIRKSASAVVDWLAAIRLPIRQ